jgi:UDP-N-acetylmuramoyl-L-alanyl-D-glutamate--2,6-diaminopimelate ligase
MRLSKLLAALPPEQGPLRFARGEDDDPVIRGLTYHSRSVTAGDLFFALRGAVVDGHDYLQQAIDLGAAAVVVNDSRRSLAPIATRFYGDPSSELTLIGVTGTNGKTSVTYLIESILARAGRRVGLIGTVEVRDPVEHERSINTTPESSDLQRMLRSMRTHGVEVVAMEVSSHGLELGRVDGCRFDVGAFTNLTQDHLDFHGTMGAYRDSKALLFGRYLCRGGFAVVNLDDPSAEDFLWAAKRSEARVLGVTRDPSRRAEIQLEAAEARLDGTRVRVRTPAGSLAFALPLVGDFNVENMLVACGVAVALDVEPTAIAAGIEGCPQVPGRVERIAAAGPDAPTVLVDYAHTPDAVDKLLRSLRPLAPGRLITVFGCGGDRDRAKRPLMAQAVARWSDRIVVTNDNPRTEDPVQILADVEGGFEKLRRIETDALDDANGAYAVVADRRAAIGAAIGIARAGDMVVLAGKGHEDYQLVGRERLPFSDGDEARRALATGGRA